jgi:hypothetical protein
LFEVIDCFSVAMAACAQRLNDRIAALFPITCGRVSVSLPLYNTMILGLAFFWIFLAAATLQDYESTLYQSDGLISLALIYASFGVSSLFAKQIHDVLGNRLSMLVAGFFYSAYALSNIFFSRILYFVASFVVGVAATLLWTAQGVCLTAQSAADDAGFYTGVFLSFYTSQGIFGYLITELLVVNGVLPDFILYLFVLFVIVGTLLFFLLVYPSPVPAADELDELHNLLHPTEPASASPRSLTQRCAAWTPRLSLSMLLEPKFGHLLPYMIFVGLYKSFLSGPFPPLFGARLLGWGMLTVAVASFLMSMISGRLVDWLGKKFLLVLASVFFIPGVIMAVWGHLSQRLYFLFISAVLLGFADNCFTTLFFVFIKMLVPPEHTAAGFGCFQFVRTLFTAVAFAYSIVLNLVEVVTLILGALVLAWIFFAYLYFFIDRFD